MWLREAPRGSPLKNWLFSCRKQLWKLTASTWMHLGVCQHLRPMAGNLLGSVCLEPPHWAGLDLVRSVHCLRVSACSLPFLPPL